MNGRVTNKQLATMIEGLGKSVDDLAGDVKAMNGRQRTDHDAITMLEANLSTTAKAQATLTLIASVLAAAIGVNINR
jgi:hypothetical protein